MRTLDFNYDLPSELIAQVPIDVRDQSRLLVLQRSNHSCSHRRFSDLPQLLLPSDVLVLNDSRVIPARIFGLKPDTGGTIEMLLVEENALNDWWAMLRPGKRVRVGTVIELQDRRHRRTGITASVLKKNPEGQCRVQFSGTESILGQLDKVGAVPLPPYIQRDRAIEMRTDRVRYQTIYARNCGSVAAPTAGLHFTNRLLERIRRRGVTVCFVSLHVGLGTFSPVKADTLEHHHMHPERFEISAETATLINDARNAGRRIVAVGTTTVRVLESVAAANEGRLVGFKGRTTLFIHPPYRFRIVDAMITNFHLPCSTLLMLVSAFASPGETSGRNLILSTYANAIRERYRFYSYGDAMLIV